MKQPRQRIWVVCAAVSAAPRAATVTTTSPCKVWLLVNRLRNYTRDRHDQALQPGFLAVFYSVHKHSQSSLLHMRTVFVLGAINATMHRLADVMRSSMPLRYVLPLSAGVDC
jgi:hypothetical protein